MTIQNRKKSNAKKADDTYDSRLGISRMTLLYNDISKRTRDL